MHILHPIPLVCSCCARTIFTRKGSLVGVPPRLRCACAARDGLFDGCDARENDCVMSASEVALRWTVAASIIVVIVAHIINIVVMFNTSQIAAAILYIFLVVVLLVILALYVHYHRATTREEVEHFAQLERRLRRLGQIDIT